MQTDLDAAHKHSIIHKAEIDASEICGCFYCERIFPPAEIKEWLKEERIKDNPHPDQPNTALCPYCGIDSVIGSASGFEITPEFLKAMSDYWF